MKKIEDLIKLIPIFTFLLIVASSIKMAIFYKVFNINIVEYINISEYIPLFIDDLHSLLYLAALFLLGAIFSKGVGIKQNKEEDVKGNKPFRITHIIMFLIMVIVLPTILYIKYDNWYERLKPMNMAFLMIMVVLLVVFATYEKLPSLFLIGWLVAILTIPIVISAYVDAYSIIDRKRLVNYEIIIDNQTLSAANNHHYLGKSKEYVFLYDISEKTSIIYPINKIKEIRITENNLDSTSN